MKKYAAFYALILTIIFICVSGCMYKDKVVSSFSIRGIASDSSGKNKAFFRSYALFKPAAGIAAMPDGGRPKFLYQNVSLYVLNTENLSIKKIIDLGEDLYPGWPVKWKLRVSWRKDIIVYGLSPLSEKFMDKDQLKYKGIYALNSDGSAYRKLPVEGQMPDLSPDAEKIVYHKVTAEGNTLLYIFNIAGGLPPEPAAEISGTDLVFCLWSEDGREILMYFSGEKYYVKSLDTATGVIRETDLPYIKNYGNEGSVKEYVKELTAADWGVPAAAEFK